MALERTQESQTSPPSVARITLHGVEYLLDLESCRSALVERSIELRKKSGGKGSGFELVADAAGVDRKTLRRFFNGDKVQVDSFADIVTRGLKLNAPDVLTRVHASEPEQVPA